MTRKQIILIGTIVMIVLIVGTISLASQSVTAQDAPVENFYSLLNRLNAENQSITIQFDRPFLAGETLLQIPDAAAGREFAEIGQDFVCFSEPWNDGQRVQCTPYTNIVSVSYDEGQ